MHRRLVCGTIIVAKDKRELARKVTAHAIYAHAGKYPVVTCLGH